MRLHEKREIWIQIEKECDGTVCTEIGVILINQGMPMIYDIYRGKEMARKSLLLELIEREWTADTLIPDFSLQSV